MNDDKKTAIINELGEIILLILDTVKQIILIIRMPVILIFALYIGNFVASAVIESLNFDFGAINSDCNTAVFLIKNALLISVTICIIVNSFFSVISWIKKEWDLQDEEIRLIFKKGPRLIVDRLKGFSVSFKNNKKNNKANVLSDNVEGKGE